MWRANCFDDLVLNYPQGSRDDVVRWFDFTDTNVTSPNTCALRLSYALQATLANAMDGFRGNTWAMRRGVRLARGAQGLARHIRN